MRTNEQIRISPILLIDEADNQIGTIETAEAIRRARETGMDLVEVAPTARPPVCRIMDYGKWKYRQNKKEQKAKQKHHSQQLKEVRLRPKTDIHDRDFKIKHAREFLLEGDRVQFTMMFRGREMAHQDLGMTRMREIAEGLVDISKVETPPRMMGKRMNMVLMPNKKGGAPAGKHEGEPKAAAPAVAAAAAPAAGPAAQASPAPASPAAAPAPPTGPTT
ncbi:MAG: translation initiation factor IF-3 [Phycisphaerae bacterium]|nr:translation initiation factor IF-3 [Phycisphaerae bacterium]